MPLPFLRAVPQGVELSVLVQPRASRTQAVGAHGGLLKIQLAAPPVDGEANEALVAFIAELLDVPRRQVTLRAGQAGRRKRVVVASVEVERVEARLRAHGVGVP